MKKNNYFNKFNKKVLKGGESKNTVGPSDEDLGLYPLQVKVYNNFDKAFKAFRTLVQSERVLSLFKEKQAYEKPSDKKRRKRNESRKRLLDLEAKQRRINSGELEKVKEKIRKNKPEEKSNG